MLKKECKTILFICGLLALLAFIIPTGPKTKVYLVGDSTMADYEPGRAPLAGWGMPFKHFFDSTIAIDNRARGGRSTRTFLSEGRWKPIADILQPGDYVLIQFGHNDEAREEKYKDRYTPVDDYKKNLLQFVSETRVKNANPVLITPVSRMRFKDGKQQETHQEYTAAVYEVAKQQNVPLVDLDKKSRELYQQLGEENTKLLFMYLSPGEHPAYPDGQKDNTHFNEYGARRIAQLVLAGLKEARVELAGKIVKGAK
jgi:lysophospholipase L1-like esterase